MTRISDMFPSKFLKAADLPGRSVVCEMSHVLPTDVTGSGKPDDVKPVLFFLGKQKGLVLNKINGTMIEEGYGDIEDWAGKSIELYESEAEFQGKRVPCIRVRCVQSAHTEPVQQPAAPASEVIPEEIPF